MSLIAWCSKVESDAQYIQCILVGAFEPSLGYVTLALRAL